MANRSWSGGKVLVIPNIKGTQLTSLAVANKMCNQLGKIVRGTSGYRMAEFHDGTGFLDYEYHIFCSPRETFWGILNHRFTRLNSQSEAAIPTK